MKIKKQSNIQFKKIKIRGDEIALLFVGLIAFLFLIFSSFRIFAVGKLFDDFIFLLLFGWSKYLVYLILFIIVIPIFFNHYIKIKFTFIVKITLTLFAISWLVQNIYLASNSSNPWFNYGMFKINFFKNTTNQWWNNTIINNYHGFFGSPITFANWSRVDSFFPNYAVGGIISNLLIALLSYCYFFTNFILSILIFLFLILFLFFDKPWNFIKIFKKNSFKNKDKKIKQLTLKKPQQKELLVANKNIIKKDVSHLEPQLEKVSEVKAAEIFTFDNLKPEVNSPVINKPSDVVIDNFKESNTLTPFGPLQSNKIEINSFEINEKFTFDNLSSSPDIKSKVNKTSKNENLNNFLGETKTNNLKYSLPGTKINSYFNNSNIKQKENEEYAVTNQNKINQLFSEFDIQGKVENYYIGTTVTKYEISIISGMRVNKITSLENELKLSLANNNIRIEAPIPGKSMIGIEVANLHIVPVTFQEQINHYQKQEDGKLLVAIGKTTLGNYLFHSLTNMPHLLIAGSTGSGKSVYINDLLVSLLLQYSYKEVKLLLIDPKWVELAIYNGIPHLLTPVINDVNQAVKALKLVILEMMKRYKLLASNNCRNIESYNNKITSENQKLPYFVVIIDELADLMVQNSKEIEETIMRITQMGRAAGIHLVVATQRPSTNIITGVIKNNIPSRIAFQVSSWVDSRTIIDSAGAEKLLGKGDMLFTYPGTNAPIRVQAPWISEEDVNNLIEQIKNDQNVNYDEDFMLNLQLDNKDK